MKNWHAKDNVYVLKCVSLYDLRKPIVCVNMDIDNVHVGHVFEKSSVNLARIKRVNLGNIASVPMKVLTLAVSDKPPKGIQMKEGTD